MPIKITLPDGSVREYESGVTGLAIAQSLSQKLAHEVLAATVNGELIDATRPITADATVTLHTFDDEQGKHAFWHSSAHLMAEALKALYPGIKFGFGPAIDNGFFYDVDPGDGKTITEAELPAVEAKMLELAKQKEQYVRREVSKAEALQIFGADNQTYKVEHVGDLAEGTISTYTQGSFTDLCAGPHIPSTEPIKAVKLTAIAGAYWRGKEGNPQLTRIYGITFPKAKLLEEYLVRLEEAKKRDHRKIGKEMKLFCFSDRVGQGLPMWLPDGARLRRRLEEFLRNVQESYGYIPVITPHIGGKNLYVTSGHYAKYGKDSFQPIHTPEEGEEYLLKPMNCPHHCEIYRSEPRSYRDLPLRYAEFGTVYRYEQSGELHGLTRVRGFTQDDSHLFVTEEQIKPEFEKVIDIILYIFSTFGFNEYTTQVSLRDPNNKTKYIGTDENWHRAESAIIEACQEKGVPFVTKTGEAAFYGPKLDFMVKDAIGREWQLGTIQVDYNLPERFELEYIGADNKPHRPVMIHRAPFGSLERFVAVLIENTAGKFPLWLTPYQAIVLPVSDKFNDYGRQVVAALTKAGVRTLIDERNEKIGRKVRDNELRRIPYMLVVGEQEAGSGTVSIRKQGEGQQGTVAIADFAKKVNDECDAILNAHKLPEP